MERSHSHQSLLSPFRLSITGLNQPQSFLDWEVSLPILVVGETLLLQAGHNHPHQAPISSSVCKNWPMNHHIKLGCCTYKNAGALTWQNYRYNEKRNLKKSRRKMMEATICKIHIHFKTVQIQITLFLSLHSWGHGSFVCWASYGMSCLKDKARTSFGVFPSSLCLSL
jgi:hypothetical protein